MEKVSRISIWFSRFVLLAAGILFTIIGVRYLANPVSAAGAFKITLGTSTAITNVRIGFGAFPLGFALALFGCLLSNKTLLAGMNLLGILIGVATAVRIFGVVMDGATPETLKVLRPEIILSCLTIVGIILEYRRKSFSAMIRQNKQEAGK